VSPSGVFLPDGYSGAGTVSLHKEADEPAWQTKRWAHETIDVANGVRTAHTQCTITIAI
jgi:hypothetical protein